MVQFAVATPGGKVPGSGYATVSQKKRAPFFIFMITSLDVDRFS